MKRLLIAAGITATILAPAGVAAAHNPHIECVASGPHAGQVHFWATDYNAGSYRVNSGTTHPFSGAFDVYLDGTVAEHGVITAPDWPTFDDSRGPCTQPTTTTTVRPTTTTTGVPSSPPTTAAPSTSSSSAPTTTSPSEPSSTQRSTTSTTTSAPPAPSSTPSTGTATPSTPGPAASSAPSSPPSAPAVDQLPVTGVDSGLIAAFATAFVLAGAAALLARRRPSWPR